MDDIYATYIDKKLGWLVSGWLGLGWGQGMMGGEGEKL
jgi:hypothetical protein